MSGDVLVTGDETLADLAWPIVAAAVHSATFVTLSLRGTVSARDCERALCRRGRAPLDCTDEVERSCGSHALDGLTGQCNQGRQEHDAGAAVTTDQRYAVYREWIMRQSVVELGLATFRRKPIDRSRHDAELAASTAASEASSDVYAGVNGGTYRAAAAAAFDVQTFRFFFIMDTGKDTTVIPCFLITPAALRQLCGRRHDRLDSYGDDQWSDFSDASTGPQLDNSTESGDETDDVDYGLVTASTNAKIDVPSRARAAYRDTWSFSEEPIPKASAENVLGFALQQGIRYLPPRCALLRSEDGVRPRTTIPFPVGPFPDVTADDAPICAEADAALVGKRGQQTATSVLQDRAEGHGHWPPPREWTPLPPTFARGQGAQLFRMLAESRIPLVFFDGLYDIMSLYEAFYAPLPPELDGFISMLTIATPQVIDARCLASLMKDSEKRADFVGRVPTTAHQRPGDGLLARMVHIALRSASVNHRHLLQSIRGGKWFVNHPRSQALRREAQARQAKRVATRASTFQDGDCQTAALARATTTSSDHEESLPGQALEAAPPVLASIHLDEMLSESNEPNASEAFASLLLVPLAKATQDSTSGDGRDLPRDARQPLERDAFSDAQLNASDAQELLAALEHDEPPDDFTMEPNLLPQTLVEHISGAALRAFQTGAVLAYLLERHGWSAVMDRFRGCISSGSSEAPIQFPLLRRNAPDASSSPTPTLDLTMAPTDRTDSRLCHAFSLASMHASETNPGARNESTALLFNDPSPQVLTGSLAHLNKTPAEYPSKVWPEAVPDARLRDQPGAEADHGSSVLPPPPYPLVKEPALPQRPGSNLGFAPEHHFIHGWLHRLVSLIAPNPLTETLFERALVAAGSIAQHSLGAHSFAIGSHTEKSYLWESGLDVGVFLAGIHAPETPQATGHVSITSPSSASVAPEAARDHTRMANASTDKTVASDVWPVRIASSLCEAAARLADRPAMVAALDRPQIPQGDAGAISGLQQWMADHRTGRGRTPQPAVRRRSRRRRRRRRREAAVPASSSAGPSADVPWADDDGFRAADVSRLGECSAQVELGAAVSPHSSSGEDHSPEAQLLEIGGDKGAVSGQGDGDGLPAGLESIDSISIERMANAGPADILVRCTINGLAVRLLLNPASALCRSRFLAECDEIIGHGHLLIRCLLLLKAWWRYSPTTSRIRALLPRAVQSMSSTLHAVLLLSYLNSIGSPNMHLVDVLCGFFHFYGFELDWTQYGMSIHGPFHGARGTVLVDAASRPPLVSSSTLTAYMIDYAKCHSSRAANPALDASIGSGTAWLGPEHGTDSASGLASNVGVMHMESRNRNIFRRPAQGSLFFLNVVDVLDPEWNIGHQIAPLPLYAQAMREALQSAAVHLRSCLQCPTREHLEMTWGVRNLLEPVWSLIRDALGTEAVLLLQRAFDEIPSDCTPLKETDDELFSYEGAYPRATRLGASREFWELLQLYGLAPEPHFTAEQRGNSGRFALNETKHHIESSTLDGLSVLPDVAQLQQQLAYVRFLVQFDTSEGGILAFLLQTLRRHRSLLVGELGQQLRSRMSAHAWHALFKARYGGLKRFLERYPDLFLIEHDHPLNPHVSLRA
jgi:hypothetical protein